MHVPLVVFVCFAFEQFLKHTPYEINSTANLERYKSEYDKHKQGAFWPHLLFLSCVCVSYVFVLHNEGYSLRVE